MCLDGSDHQKESDNYIFRSINHEMYLQKEVKKSTTSQFDHKRCYIKKY